jgi:hypothetical protein
VNDAEWFAHLDSATTRPGPDVHLACDVAERFGGTDGDHHKAWVIDQMMRALKGTDYAAWVVSMMDGEDGPDTYGYDEGIPP